MTEPNANMGFGTSGAVTDNSNSVPNQIPTDSSVNNTEKPPVVSDTDNTVAVNAVPPRVPTVTSDTSQKDLTPNNPITQANSKLQDANAVKIMPPSTHYAAKVVNGIMDVLVPKQFNTVVNADGSTSQVPRPRNRKDIGLAIGLAAITGAFSGLGEKGPGATGRAATAGFNNVVAQRERVDQQQNQQALADFSRKQGTVDYNMRVAASARQAGMEDKAENDSVVSALAPLVDEWENSPNMGDIIKYGSREAPISEDEAADISKHSPFNFMRVAVNTVPRVNQNGEQVWIGVDGKIVPEGTQGAHRAWDHGYILVDKNAKSSLSDENGPKKWVTEGVTKWPGLVPGLTSALLVGDGAKGQIPAYAAGKMQLQVQNLDNTQSILDKYVQTLDEDKKPSDPGFVKPIDLKKSIQSGLVTLKDLQNLQNAAGNSSQGNSTVLNTQIDAIRAKDPKSANRLQALFGGDNLETYKQTVLAKGAALKSAEEKRLKGLEIHSLDDAKDIISKNKANPGTIPANLVNEAQNWLNEDVSHHGAITYEDETQRNRVAQEEQAAQDARTMTPGNFRPDPNVLTKLTGPDDLKSYLQKNNVPIPSDFESLYSVGREYSDNLNKVFPTRVSRGTNQTDANHALDYIHKYINANYNDANFDAGKRFIITLNDPQRSPTISAGVASQHLDLLRTAGKNLENGDLVALNQIANAIGVATGKSAPVVFKAIADQVNQEVGKVVAGGQAYEAEIKNLNDNLGKNQSPEQIDRVIRGYIGLMAGRLNELDFDHKRLFNKPLPINPTVTDLFNRYHQSTAWESGSPRYVNGKLIGYTTDGKTLSRVVN